MGAECLDVVKERTREQGEDVRLQPMLFRACQKELELHCRTEYGLAHKDDAQELHGRALMCLRQVVHCSWDWILRRGFRKSLGRTVGSGRGTKRRMR